MQKEFKWSQSAAPREMALGLGVVVFLSIFIIQQLILPLMDERKSVRGSVETKSVELAAYKKFLNKSSNASNAPKVIGGSALTQIHDKVRDSFENTNLAPDVVVSDMLSALTQPEWAKSALLGKFSSTGEKKQLGFTETGLDLRLTGKYDGIADYLSRVHQLPYLLKVDSIEVKPLDNPEANQVELVAKSVLYVGEPQAVQASNAEYSRSDIGIDLLQELNAFRPARTPFAAQPREMAVWSLHELKLTATMAGSSRPSAIINNKLFELGDELADFKIIEIRAGEVTLQRGRSFYRLQMAETPENTSEEDSESQPAESAPIDTARNKDLQKEMNPEPNADPEPSMEESKTADKGEDQKTEEAPSEGSHDDTDKKEELPPP